MSEIGKGEPQEFITNALGITHFINGKGTLEEPYKPQGSTLLNDSIMDSYNTACYIKDREAKVFFTHNNNLVGINRNMQASFPEKEGETIDTEFQNSVEEITKQLREDGHRPLTEQELKEWQNQLAKEQAQREKRARGPMGLVDKIIEKISFR